MKIQLFLVLVVLACVASELITGWKSPRFPIDKEGTCQGTCDCGVDEGVCNIKCPGPSPAQATLNRVCDPTGGEESNIQSASTSCTAVITGHTGGVQNDGRPLKIAGQFTTVGEGENCYTLRLGNETSRQTVEYDLWPYINNVEGFFDMVIYEKGSGTMDPFPSTADFYTAEAIPDTIPLDDFTPEAFAISLKLGFENVDDPEQSAPTKWSDWYFQGVNILWDEAANFPVIDSNRQPTTTSYEVFTETYMTAYNFDSFGARPLKYVSAVRIMNLQPTDMVYGGTDGTQGWVAMDGEGCDAMDCFEPQYLSNGRLTSYAAQSYDPDLFWISEILDSQRETSLLIQSTTGTVPPPTTTTTSGTSGTSTSGTSTSGTSTTTSGTSTGSSTSGSTSTSSGTTTTGTGTGTTATTGTTGTSGTSGTTGTTGVGAGTTGIYTGRATITRVIPRFGNEILVSPDGIQVFGFDFFPNPRFRCLFGGVVETALIRAEDDSVFCEGPSPTDFPSSSNVPMTIQVLNDNEYPEGVSNSLTFIVIFDVIPNIAWVEPNSADRFCVSNVDCEPVVVYGTDLEGASRIDCVWFDSYTKPGRYDGSTRIDGQIYQKIRCEQTAVYPEHMTEAITRPDGFYVLLYKNLSGPTPSNKLEWTYTCDPCDA